jgi:hypothetical protein
MFTELAAYKEINGHCNVPRKYGNLGSWCTDQRHNRNQGKLTPERIAQLDALGFCWDIVTALWDKNYIELVAYKKANGHCNVPHGNGPLGLWCANLRNRRSKLSPERIAQLDALGFSWDPFVTGWEKKVIELVDYKEVNGDCNVPQSGSPLGRWCTSVRQLYKQHKLTSERIAQLDALGFCWDAVAALWDKNVAELVTFKKVNGHCKVVNSGPFGRWCRNVRQYRKQGVLSEEKIAQLDAIGFLWDPFTTAWDKKLVELAAYKKINGHCNVNIDSGPLGTWCDNIRQRQAILSQEKIAQLDALGFLWNPLTTAWDKKVAELVAYKEFHGHCNVPTESSSLGRWCNSARNRRKNSKLTSKQIAQLDALGFCWNTLAAAWDKKYAELVAYKEVHGHCNVPQGNGSLGSWCNNQRNRRNSLTLEQIAKLEALGFYWNPSATVWAKRFIELTAYKEAHGHCNVPIHGSSLGVWLSNQRRLYLRHELAQDLIDQLNTLEVSWDIYSDAFEKKFTELAAYKEANGHCNPPRGGKLHTWCQMQRAKYTKGLLKPQQIQQLEALGFCWSLRQTSFRKLIADLTEFKAVNGHCNPDGKTPFGRRCLHMRLAKKWGKGLSLTDENVAELVALGFSFDDPRKERRKQFIAELTEFKAKYGHCDLPPGTPFSRWAQVMRQYKRKNRLNDDEITQLNALGFHWDPLAIAWDKKYAELVAYKEVHGHCNVPQASGSLGVWCDAQRQCHRKRKLSPERMTRLNALGFRW